MKKLCTTKKVLFGTLIVCGILLVTIVVAWILLDRSDAAGLAGVVTGLAGNGEQEKEIYERLLGVISKEHCVQEVSGTASKGSFNLETKVISIREDLEYLQKIKTLLHEYAHLLDFQMHPEDDISRNRRELIAESVAFIVSLRLGLDTSRYSMSYIKSWLKDKEELKIIADSVQKIAYTIITELAESSDSAFSMLKEESEE